MSKKLLMTEDVRKTIKFKHFNKGLTIMSIRRAASENSRWKFDFDVYLPSKGMNLQRGLV